MSGGPERLGARGISVLFDPTCGIVERLAVTDEGLEVAPFHRAPWVTSEALPEGAAPHLTRLGGDFPCAPFGGRDGGSPLHGWTANARWRVVLREPGRLRAVLERRVGGATVAKELLVEDGSPFLVQRHTFLGGRGRLPVANHANLSLPRGGLVRASPKRVWETPVAPP